jgi:transcriptional regulator with XRE-family HTH domain
MWSREKFSESLKSLRMAKNMKQGDLGIALGLSKQAISDMENGKRATTLENLVALANFFNVSLDYLVGRSDDPKRH